MRIDHEPKPGEIIFETAEKDEVYNNFITEDTVYSIFRKRFKEKREEKNLTFDQIGLMTGISKSNLQRYESGETGKIPIDAALKIENALRLPPGYLCGYVDDAPSDIKPLKKAFLPLIVSTEGMPPVLTDKIMQIATSSADNVQTASFCCYMNDNSMTGARIHKGDAVFIKSEDTLKNGDIGAFETKNGLLIRYYYHDEKYYTLCAANPEFPPLNFRSFKSENIQLIGKVVAFQGKL